MEENCVSNIFGNSSEYWNFFQLSTEPILMSSVLSNLFQVFQSGFLPLLSHYHSIFFFLAILNLLDFYWSIFLLTLFNFTLVILPGNPCITFEIKKII